MTVIAAYNYHNCGIVLGDILISGEISDDHECNVELPSLEKTSRNLSGYGVRGTRQKVAIITDYCAIAWAGTEIVAHTFIDKVMRFANRANKNNNKITEEILRKIFEKYFSTYSLSIVGAIYDDNFELSTFGLASNAYTSKELGHVFAAGTGEEAVKEYLDIVEKMNLLPVAEDEISAQGVTLILNQVLHLLNTEYRQDDLAASILQFFGGGYEIAAYYDGKFRKVEARYIFYDLTCDNAGIINIELPRVVISHGYDCSGNAIYHSIETSEKEEGKVINDIKITSQPFIKQEFMPKNINDIKIFNCLAFNNTFEKKPSLMSIIKLSKNVEILIMNNDGMLRCHYSQKVTEEIEEYIKKYTWKI